LIFSSGLVLVFLFTIFPLWADIAIPTEIGVCFEKNGKPYKKPVDFNVTCFGRHVWPHEPPSRLEEPLSKVFSFSAQCPTCGCKIEKAFHMNYIRVEYCDLEGTVSGKRFKVEKYAKEPVSDCKGDGFRNHCQLRVKIP